MRSTLDHILNKFGVDYALRPYETIPFDYFNADKRFDVMAEIGMSGDKKIITAAIQRIEHTDDDLRARLIFQFQAEMEPNGAYMPRVLRILNVDMTGKANWFDGGCRFFKQCTALIKKNTAPDFDAIRRATFGDSTKEGDMGENFSGGSSSRGLKKDKPALQPPKPPGKIS